MVSITLILKTEQKISPEKVYKLIVLVLRILGEGNSQYKQINTAVCRKNFIPNPRKKHSKNAGQYGHKSM